MRGGAFDLTGGGESFFFLAMAKHSVRKYRYAPALTDRTEAQECAPPGKLRSWAPGRSIAHDFGRRRTIQGVQDHARNSFNCRRSVVGGYRTYGASQR
jgi:hypothetical protein